MTKEKTDLKAFTFRLSDADKRALRIMGAEHGTGIQGELTRIIGEAVRVWIESKKLN